MTAPWSTRDLVRVGASKSAAWLDDVLNELSSVAKANPYHKPEGPGGGQFTTAPSGGAGTGGTHAAVPDNGVLRAAVEGKGSRWSFVLERFAAETSTPVALARQEIRDAVTQTLDACQVWTRVESRVLSDILFEPAAPDDVTMGHFLNQYVTGESNGTYDPMMRLVAEDLMFGYRMPVGSYVVEANKGIMRFDTVKNRPVYGYVTPNPDGYASPVESKYYDPAQNYGEVAVRFKPEIRERTTVTWGDSLGMVGEYGTSRDKNRYDLLGSDIGIVVADRPPNFAKEYLRGMPVPLTAPTEHLVLPGAWGVHPASRAKIEAMWNESGMYMEAQVHGDHLTADSVAEVVFHTSIIKPELERTLKRLGIPYRIAPSRTKTT